MRISNHSIAISKDALTQTDKKDIIIVTGYWNAKVGQDNTDWTSVMGKYGYGGRNERGERLLEFATLHNLFICNTRFEQKPNRKWTWASPDGIHRNMIDLILIQHRWKTSVINCRTFQSGRYQLRPLISSVQHKAATQEIVQQIAAELQS